MTAERIGRLAVQALIAEVEATPKPGLVDRAGSGAHRDMDIHTFYKSAAALRPHFIRFAELGAKAETLPALFSALRLAGQAGERDMFAATDGVNTHKGALFSLGLLCGGAGYLSRRGEVLDWDRLCGVVQIMTAGLCRREYGDLDRAAPLTKGERMYLTHGVTGVRGEAESGFASVRKHSLPFFSKRWTTGDKNAILLETLLTLMAEVTDTNILSRHDMETARYVKGAAAEVLAGGPQMADIAAFDRELTARYISPGGSADLLSVTIFLYSLRYDLDSVL